LHRGGANKNLIKKISLGWISTMQPFVPHLAEELWNLLKGKGFASLSQIPKPNAYKKDEKAENLEKFLAKLMEDIETVRKLVKDREIKKITLFVAGDWKRLSRTPQENIKTQKIQEPRLGISQKEEIQFLEESKTFIEKELNLKIEIIPEQKSENPKSKRAQEGKPAIFAE
jgi:leucyl-tRNA synthetase